MSQQHDRASSRAGRATTRRAQWILTGIAFLQLFGCTTLTDVSAPDVVQPAALENPTGGLALWAGAVSRTTTALTQTVVYTGELSDELFSAAAAGSDPDRRRLPDPAISGLYPYTPMHAARGNILQAIGVLERVAPQPASRIGQLFALMGFIELSLAEQICSGVPLGAIQDGQDVPGQPLTTAQMYARAIADFDSALVYAVDSARIGNLARVGRGRAYLELGQLPAARAAVATVPTTYVYRTENSASVQPNAVFDAINNSKRSTVADREGLNGLNFRSASDPRVPTQLLGKGADGVTDLYGFTPYSSLASPIVLASGVEARLIEAEASLGGGSATDALANLNALRANAPGLPPLMLQSDDAGRVDQLFRERAFWLFLSGHRQGDLRRLVRRYGRTQDAVFPTGPYKGGATYGSDVNFAPEFAQLNNPNYHGCLDRAP
jgi:starch-binding outer membrane protein, SusD/RagB family